MPNINFILAFILALLSCSTARAVEPRAEGVDAVGAVRAVYGADTEILGVYVEDLDWINETLTTVKFINPANHLPAGITIDSTGRVLGDHGTRLTQQNIERRFDLRGSLNDDLWNRVLAAKSADEIPVAIWLRTHEPAPADGTAQAMAASASIRTESQNNARSCLASEWPSLSSAALPVFGADSPVAFAKLHPDDLMLIAHSPCISAIFPDTRDDDPVEFESCVGFPDSERSPYVSTTRVDAAGLDGAGQTVCMLEVRGAASPNNLTIAADRCPAPPGSANDPFWVRWYYHARRTAGVVRSGVAPFGVAPSATIVLSEQACGGTGGVPMKFCADHSAGSWSVTYAADALATRLIDYWARQPPYPFVSLAAGQVIGDSEPDEQCIFPETTPNLGDRSVVANTSYNGLVVGGVKDCQTASVTDDRVYYRQYDRNPGDGRELPQLLAPAVRIDSDGDTFASCSNGTSYSAPIVAGIAAGLQTEYSGLVGWPEATRAVLMAGAHNVEGGPLDLTDGVDDRDGTGEVDALLSGVIASHQSNRTSSPEWYAFDRGQMYSSTTPASSMYATVYHAMHAINGGRLRVVLTWDSTATCTSAGLTTASCTSNIRDADLDLYVFEHGNWATMETSTSVANNYEVVDFETSPGKTYDIYILAYSWANSSTRFGIAWIQWPSEY